MSGFITSYDPPYSVGRPDRSCGNTCRIARFDDGAHPNDALPEIWAVTASSHGEDVEQGAQRSARGELTT